MNTNKISIKNFIKISAESILVKEIALYKSDLVRHHRNYTTKFKMLIYAKKNQLIWIKKATLCLYMRIRKNPMS
jgi:hypothetical protein